MYLAVIVIVVNGLTGQQTTRASAVAQSAPLFLALLYLATARRSWLAWLLLATVTATVGILMAPGVIENKTSNWVAGMLYLATTAAVIPLEPGKGRGRRRKASPTDGSLGLNVVTVGPGHD